MRMFAMSSKSYTLHPSSEQRAFKLSSFVAVKYTSFAFAILLLIGSIISLIAGPSSVDTVLVDTLDDDTSDKSMVNSIKNAWYWASAATLVIAICGTVGIWSEKLWLTSIYAIYLMLTLFGSIMTTSVWRSNPMSLVILAIFTGWTLMFNFLLLRKVSDGEFDSPPIYSINDA